MNRHDLIRDCPRCTLKPMAIHSARAVTIAATYLLKQPSWDYTMAVMIARTVNCSAKLFSARKYLPSGSEVCTHTVCSCGVGFVVGLRVLEDNESCN